MPADPPPRRFTDRRDAGRVLATFCAAYAARSDVVVLALPRGGVPVAYEVARRLGAPLDVYLVRKLGVPGHEELAMGAVASGGVQVLNESIASRIPAGVIEQAAQRELAELQRRESAYRAGQAPCEPAARTVVLVDDGLATGASMRAAVIAVRRLGPQRVIVAVPVGPRQTVSDLRRWADEVICPVQPAPFRSVGTAYDDFTQTTDDEVIRLLQTGR